MITKQVIDSDIFLDMPLSTQALYIHLNIHADDDGFVNNPKKIQRMIGASNDDYKLLIAKEFIIEFESGIIVVRHWRLHNYIAKDRYHATIYQSEKESLQMGLNGAYERVYGLYTQDRLGKKSIVQIREELGEIERELYL